MIWEFALIGLLSGLAAGYLGIGGGIIIVPALTLLFSRHPDTAPIATQMAVATSLASMLATSFSAVLAHHRHGAILWAQTARLAPGLLLGALVGAWLAISMDSDTLAAVFGVFALGAAAQMLSSAGTSRERSLPGWGGSGLVGLVIGGVSALVGIGGGVLTGPYLMAHGVAPKRAVATASACGYPIAVSASLAFVVLGADQAAGDRLGFVHLPALVGIAVVSVLAAPVGAWAVHKSPPHWVRRAFAVLLLVVALRMILQAF